MQPNLGGIMRLMARGVMRRRRRSTAASVAQDSSDHICKAIWKGFIEQMLADYGFKAKETPPILSLPTQTTGALPCAFSEGHTAQKVTPGPPSGPLARES